MATNKPETRKTHITRIFGTNADGDILSDIYADVERMDIVKGALQVPSDNPAIPLQWQGLQRKFRWNDDPNGDDYSPEGTPSRKLEIVKVCDVETEADVNDPEEWIPIKSIRSLRTRVETGTEANGGTAMDRFLSSVTQQELTTARFVEVRRIVHYDTNIDDDAQSAADAGLKEYVVSSDDYEKDIGTKDEDQYAEHEIIRYLKHKGNAGDVGGIGRQTKLLNDYLIEEAEAATQEITGNGGVNPPYRLDPFQNIVNIKFGPPDQQYMASWDGAGADGSAPPASDFGGNSGATVGAWTVFTDGFVASGQIKVVRGGATVRKTIYLRAPFKAQSDFTPTQVFSGEIHDGAVVWTPVFEAPGRVTAISYANKKFFVSSISASNYYLSVTSDDQNFITVQPWAGSAAPNGGVSGGGNVAYMNLGTAENPIDRYVMTGSTLATEDVTTPAVVISDGLGCNEDYTETVFDFNFAWAVSPNGLTWSTGFSPAVYTGIAAGAGSTGTTVAAGNGVFVAGAGKKNTFRELNPAPDGQVVFSCCTDAPVNGHCNVLQAPRPDYVLDSAAVAVSTDGRNWRLVTLPGAQASSSVDGDTSSNGNLVAFIKHKKPTGGGDGPSPDDINGKKPTGFFIATSQTQTHASGGLVFSGRIFKSVDGFAWKLISTDNSRFYRYLSAIAEHLVNTVEA